MSLNSIKLEIGKSYPIEYVIKQLEQFPEVQLGHIVVMHEHLYHVNRLRLDEEAKKIKKMIAEGGKEYEKRGKKFVPTSDVTILSIVDPYERYEKYSKFYMAFEPDIDKAIIDSKKGNIAAPTDALLSEAMKIVEISDEEEFLDGLGLFFKRRGIDTSSISGGKYILFEMHKLITPKKDAISDSVTLERELERKLEKEYEQYGYGQYDDFYENFYRQIMEGISGSKKGEIAAPIDATIDEAKKIGFTMDGNEIGFLRGMEIFFDLRGIKFNIVDNKYITFRNKNV